MCLARHLLVALVVAAGLALPAAAAAQEPLDDESFELHYDAWHGDRRDADLVRVVFWDLTLIAIGTAWYWSEKDLNKLDWDYPTAWERINGDAVRFDNNRFMTNGLGHPVAGMGYYGMSRVSGLEPWQAVLSAFLSSALWEWGLEWREMVSINDQIFTPVGGIALGEHAFQLGEYLNSAPGGGSWANQAAAATLGFPRWLHDRIDGVEAPESLERDSLGFSSNWWHRFRIGYEWQGIRNEERVRDSLHGVRIESELVSMPGFMKPGSFDVAFSHGNYSELLLRASTSGSGIDDFDLRARSVLAGFYTQDVRVDSTGNVHGHGAMLGIGSAFRHTDRNVFGRIDQVGVASILGPSTDVRIVAGDLRLRFGADVYADFAAVQSLAYVDWEADHDEQVLRSVLTEQGYYYGYGLSSRLHLEAEFRGLEVGGSLRYGSWKSIEGLDRRQQLVTDDIPLADQDVEYEAWVGYTVPRTPLYVRVTAGGETRSSQMDGVDVDQTVRRYGGVAGLSF